VFCGSFFQKYFPAKFTRSWHTLRTSFSTVCPTHRQASYTEKKRFKINYNLYYYLIIFTIMYYINSERDIFCFEKFERTIRNIYIEGIQKFWSPKWLININHKILFVCIRLDIKSISQSIKSVELIIKDFYHIGHFLKNSRFFPFFLISEIYVTPFQLNTLGSGTFLSAHAFVSQYLLLLILAEKQRKSSLTYVNPITSWDHKCLPRQHRILSRFGKHRDRRNRWDVAKSVESFSESFCQTFVWHL